MAHKGVPAVTDSKKEKGLGLALLNGMVLALIGALVLITPLLPSAVLTGPQRTLDNVAGGFLFAVGLLLLAIHIVGPKAPDHEDK